MVDRPHLAPWYRIADLGDALGVEHGQAVVRLDGAAAKNLLPRLLPLLDGTRTLDEIVECLGERIRPAVEHAIGVLTERRLLLDGPPAPDGEHTVARLLAASVGKPETGLGQALEDARVAVAGAGPAAVESARALRAAGIGEVVRADWSAVPACDLAVAAPAPEEVVRLEGWNRAALAARTTWIQLLPFDGRFAAIGPLFVPQETCCHVCYRLRRRANIPYPLEFEAVEAVPTAAATPPPVLAAMAGLGALVAARWLAAADPALPGRLFALDLRQVPELTEHHVYRVPRCPACARLEVRPLPWFKETGAAAG
jgi:bacteriocin biosynthesis cyclodehydratase domain-containing protein